LQSVVRMATGRSLGRSKASCSALPLWRNRRRGLHIADVR
jgi:hypothetical protein